MAQTRWKNLPILSAAAPFKSGGRSGPSFYTDIPAGPLALKNIADIYLYPNTVQIVKVSGSDVKEWLERSAGIFNRIDPTKSDEQPLINPAFPAFNFDVIDGVTYRSTSRRPRATTMTASSSHRRAPHPRPRLRRPADRRESGIPHRHQ
jgi:2',3'-cyclic-nucleotide 2'-phosphodiesterase/3'-nucleotidase